MPADLLFREDLLRCWVIYKHPSDYPDHYVVRQWLCTEPPTPFQEAQLADTLEEARALLPPGLKNVGKGFEVDQVIEEVWMFPHEAGLLEIVSCEK
jgi:hypothetical protein